MADRYPTRYIFLIDLYLYYSILYVHSTCNLCYIKIYLFIIKNTGIPASRCINNESRDIFMIEKAVLSDEQKELLNSKAKGFFIQRSYVYEIHDAQGNVIEGSPSEAEWKEQIIEEIEDFKKNHKCEFINYIFHDKDYKDDEVQSGLNLHVHIIIKMKNSTRMQAMINKFKVSRIENISKVKSYSRVFRYSLHITDAAINKKKVIYPISEMNFWHEDDTKTVEDMLISKKSKEEEEEIEDEIEQRAYHLHKEIRHNGKTKKQAEKELYEIVDEEDGQLAEKAYQQHRHGYVTDENEYLTMKADIMKVKGRDLRNVYIEGRGGLGKTKLGRAIALLNDDTGRGYHGVSLSSEDKTFDMVSKYKGESVSVLDEVTSDFFNLREFLNIFDPYNYSPVSSRNIDKDWIANMSIFTNSETLTGFKESLMMFSKGGSRYQDESRSGQLKNDSETKDVYYQISRRFRNYIKMEREIDSDKTRIRVFSFDDDLKGFVYAGYTDAHFKFAHNEFDLKVVAKNVMQLMDSKSVFSSEFENKVLKEEGLEQDENNTFTMSNLVAWESR